MSVLPSAHLSGELAPLCLVGQLLGVLPPLAWAWYVVCPASAQLSREQAPYFEALMSCYNGFEITLPAP